MFELKKYRGLIFYDTGEWCKIWRKSDLWFQNDMGNLANFHQSSGKFENWDFDGILLSKLENVWAKNLKGSYNEEWQWRMIQNLKRNWLVSSKLTRRIWRILIRALENLTSLHFNVLLLIKTYNFWTQKVSYMWWHWILMQNLK